MAEQGPPQVPPEPGGCRRPYRGVVVEYFRAKHGGEAPKEPFIHGKIAFSDEEWEGFASAVPAETNLVGVHIRQVNDMKAFTLGKMPATRLCTAACGEEGAPVDPLASTPILAGRCRIPWPWASCAARPRWRQCSGICWR